MWLPAEDVHLRGVRQVEFDAIAEGWNHLLDVGTTGAASLAVVDAENADGEESVKWGS